MIVSRESDVLFQVKETSSRFEKDLEKGSEGISTWMLKSPVIRSSEVDETRSSSREDISEIKTDSEEIWGWYIVSKVSDDEEMLNLVQRDSNAV